MVNRSALTLALLGAALSFAGAAAAHDVPNMKHTHAFKQTGYGAYRQGHTVNGPQGSITIYSPRSYGAYSESPPVRFARPGPITKAPGRTQVPARPEADPGLEYGRKDSRR